MRTQLYHAIFIHYFVLQWNSGLSTTVKIVLPLKEERWTLKRSKSILLTQFSSLDLNYPFKSDLLHTEYQFKYAIRKTLRFWRHKTRSRQSGKHISYTLNILLRKVIFISYVKQWYHHMCLLFIFTAKYFLISYIP